MRSVDRSGSKRRSFKDRLLNALLGRAAVTDEVDEADLAMERAKEDLKLAHEEIFSYLLET